MGEYFKPAKNVIYERYKFGGCKQETDETIDVLLGRSGVVLGHASENTRRLLLPERELMLPAVVVICRLAELTEKRMKTMESQQVQTDSVNAAEKRN